MSTMLSDKVEQVSGATGETESAMNDRINAGNEDIRRQVREWKDEIVDSLKKDKTWGDPDALDAPQYQTSQALTGVKDAVRADAEEMIHRVEDYVIDHPLKSLGIAVGVGFLLGVIWSH